MARTLLEQCLDPPAVEPGDHASGSSVVRWSPDAIKVEVPVLGQRLRFDADRPGALQLSRSRAQVATRFGRRVERAVVLVELRADGQRKLQLVAPVDDDDADAVLDGLPEVDVSGEHVSLETAHAVLFTALHLGARLAQLPSAGAAPVRPPAPPDPIEPPIPPEPIVPIDEAPSKPSVPSVPSVPLTERAHRLAVTVGRRLLPALPAIGLVVGVVSLGIYVQRCKDEQAAAPAREFNEGCLEVAAAGVRWHDVWRADDGTPHLVALEQYDARQHGSCYRVSILDPTDGTVVARQRVRPADSDVSGQLWVLGLGDDGRLWIIGNDHELYAFDVRDGRRLATLDDILTPTAELRDLLLDSFHHGAMHVDTASGDVLIDAADGGHLRIDADTLRTTHSPDRRPTPTPDAPCTTTARFAAFMPDGRWIGFRERDQRGALTLLTEPTRTLRPHDREKIETAAMWMTGGLIDGPSVHSDDTFLRGIVYAGCDHSPVRLDDPMRVVVGHQTLLGERGEPLLSLVEPDGPTHWTLEVVDSPVQLMRLVDDVLVVYQGSPWVENQRVTRIQGIDPTSGQVRWILE